jgi:hypothetical protein
MKTEWQLIQELVRQGRTVLIHTLGEHDREQVLAIVRTGAGGKLYPATVDGLACALAEAQRQAA